MEGQRREDVLELDAVEGAGCSGLRSGGRGCGWLDWMEEEMDGSVVAGFGSGKIPRKEEPCPSALVGPVGRSRRGRWVAAVGWNGWMGRPSLGFCPDIYSE